MIHFFVICLFSLTPLSSQPTSPEKKSPANFFMRMTKKTNNAVKTTTIIIIKIKNKKNNNSDVWAVRPIFALYLLTVQRLDYQRVDVSSAFRGRERWLWTWVISVLLLSKVWRSRGGHSPKGNRVEGGGVQEEAGGGGGHCQALGQKN